MKIHDCHGNVHKLWLAVLEYINNARGQVSVPLILRNVNDITSSHNRVRATCRTLASLECIQEVFNENDVYYVKASNLLPDSPSNRGREMTKYRCYL